MRVLLISLLLPHPRADHASAFTVFKMIRHLADRHDVSLVSFVRSEEEGREAQEVGEFCRSVDTVLIPHGIGQKLRERAGLLGLKPIALSNSLSREMTACINRVMNDRVFDVAHVEYTPMGQYASLIKELPSLITVHDIVHLTARRSAKELRFSRKKLEWMADSLVCRRYEARIYSAFDRVVGLSKDIKQRLHAMNPSLDVTVIPPGVDIPERTKVHAPGPGRHLVYMGAMWRDENIESVLYFYNSVFKRIQSQIPDVMLHVVGGRPSDEIKRLSADPAVRVTGYVDDLVSYYLDCDVSIAPIRIAGGVMCKILDAMAVGLPVVTTEAGNEGIGAKPNEEILVASNAEEFADCTIQLLKNSEERRRLSTKARDFVRRSFSWQSSIDKIEQVYEVCVRDHQQSAESRL